MMRPDQERVSSMISDTILLLCKSGLSFEHGIKVQGLIGITVDENQVFLVQINEYQTQSNSFHDDVTASTNNQLPLSTVINKSRKSSLYDQHNSRKRQKLPTFDQDFCDVITIKNEMDDMSHDDCCVIFGGNGEETTGNKMIPDSSDFLEIGRNSLKRSFDFGGMGMETGSLMMNSTILPTKSDFDDHQINNDFKNSEATVNAVSNYDGSNVCAVKNRGQKRTTIKQERTFSKPKQDKYQGSVKSILTKYKQQQSSPFIVTKSLHECAYPDCGKQFRHKQHLLRHQTQKHGRMPTKILTMQKDWNRTGGRNIDETTDYDEMEDQVDDDNYDNSGLYE